MPPINSTHVSFFVLILGAGFSAPVCGQDSQLPVDAVFQQIFAEHKRLRTFEGKFTVTEKRIISSEKNGLREIVWDATYYYEYPDKYCLEYRSSVDGKQTSEAFAGGDASKHVLQTESNGARAGSVSREYPGGTYQGPYTAAFIYHIRIPSMEKYGLPLDAWSVHSDGSRLLLSGPGLSADSRMAIEVDPGKNYFLTRITNESQRGGKVDTSLELFEAAPGIWIPLRGICQHWDRQKRKSLEYNFELNKASAKVNHSISPSVFQLEFPKGTLVSDTLAKRSYFVGDDSRGKEDLDEMLSKARAMDSNLPANPLPRPGALIARQSFWFAMLIPALFGLISLAAVLSVIILRRQRRLQD